MSERARRVVVTGMGTVSPHGRGVDALWNGLLEGRSGLKPLTLFDASVFRNPSAGVVEGYPEPIAAPATPAMPRGPLDRFAPDDSARESALPDESLSRALRMLLDAAREALVDALGAAPTASRAELKALAGEKGFSGAGLVTGTNFGGMAVAERALVAGRGDVAKAPLDGYLFGAATALLAGRFGLRGPQMNLSLSCASGTAAIGLAADMIRSGRAEVALAAGYDELSLFIYAGLSALRAITPETLRPFDARRKGTLFSEGAGVWVLESEEHARKRGARIQARITGRFMNNDAYHMTAPEQEAHGIQALMRGALADAELTSDQVDHVNLHATGTPFNDAIETKAIHSVFGARGPLIPVCSVKSSIGHTLGAAGIIEATAAVRTLRDGKVPPVQGLELEHKDPACDLNTPVGTPLNGRFERILKTSYGFGGTNAAVVLEKAVGV